MVPVYLVVGGVTSCAYWLLVMVVQTMRKRREELEDGDITNHRGWTVLNILMNLFIAGWCILGKSKVGYR